MIENPVDELRGFLPSIAPCDLDRLVDHHAGRNALLWAQELASRDAEDVEIDAGNPPDAPVVGGRGDEIVDATAIGQNAIPPPSRTAAGTSIT